MGTKGFFLVGNEGRRSDIRFLKSETLSQQRTAMGIIVMKRSETAGSMSNGKSGHRNSGGSLVYQFIFRNRVRST